MAYISGNVARFNVSFKNDATGALVDPTVVTFKYQLNSGTYTVLWTWDGVTTTPAIGVIARISLGVYEVWVDLTGLSGTLTGLWKSTGANQASVPDSITVGQGSGSGLTFGDLIENVFRRAIGPVQERFVLINQTGGIGSNDITITYDGAEASNVSPGDKFSIDLENILVISTSGTVATVQRGFDGSQKATHADDAIIYINSEVTRFDIGVAINDDLNDLSSPSNGLFRVGVAQLTYNAVYAGYDLGALPSNFIDILAVSYRDISPSRSFPEIVNWDIRTWNAGTTDPAFPSGQGIILYEEAYPGLPIYVTYSAPFIPLVQATDSIINTPASNDNAPPLNGYSTAVVPNLALTMSDIPPLGATIAIIQPLEIGRNDMSAQGDARKAAEVPAGAEATSTNPMDLRRTKRINAEYVRLYKKYPDRRR